MIIKRFLQLFSVMLLYACAVNGQQVAPHHAAPVYKLPAPEGWGTERIPFPIEFAPQITYKGTEDLRFAPNWGNPESEQHWAYAFLWWLEGTPAINTRTLQKDLTAYYEGLVGRNITQRKIPENKLVPVKTSIKKATTAAGDAATYTGTVRMLNYMTQLPITLRCAVHVRSCQPQTHTAVYIEISPREFTHAVWKELDNIWVGFTCE